MDKPPINPYINPAIHDPSHNNINNIIESDDWTRNWRASIAVKITAVVIWGIMPIAFAITIPLLSSVDQTLLKNYKWWLDELGTYVESKLKERKNIDPEDLRDDIYQFQKKSGFVYLKLYLPKDSIILGEKKPDSQRFIYKITTHELVGENYNMEVHFPSLSYMKGIERAKYGSAIVAFTVIFGLFLVFIINHIVHKPFQALVHMTQLISSGHMNVRLAVNREDEFGSLSLFFNRMLDQLDAKQLELRRANQELTEEIKARDEALAASRAKSSFLANMSHEIRTPLTAILGYAESLHLYGARSPEEEREAMATIVRNGKHLLNIINDILDISKIEADKLEIEKLLISPFQLVADIEKLLAYKAREKGLQFSIHYQYPLPKIIDSDPTRLKQILLNLVSNAIRFTEKGEIKIRLSYQPQTALFCYSIIDTGIGMSPEQTKTLFTAYTQAQVSTTRCYGGTGLGLMISKRLAELMGGTIKLESVEGVGSKFDVYVACGEVESQDLIYDERDIPIEPVTTDPAPTPSTLLKGNVLIVEDVEDNQKLIAMYLRQAGISSEIATNGKEGIAKALKGQFDLVFMDMNMPIMDGLEATKRLRALHYPVPIIALTANALKNEAQKYLDAGCNKILTKPLELNEFYATLRFYLKRVTPPKRLTPNRVPPLPQPAPLAPAKPSSPTATAPKKSEFQQLQSKFLASLPQYLNQLQQALQQKNWAEIRSLAHRLKGLGGSFGQPEITRLAGIIQDAIDTNHYTEISRDLQALEKYCRLVNAETPAAI